MPEKNLTTAVRLDSIGNPTHHKRLQTPVGIARVRHARVLPRTKVGRTACAALRCAGSNPTWPSQHLRAEGTTYGIIDSSEERPRVDPESRVVEWFEPKPLGGPSLVPKSVQAYDRRNKVVRDEFGRIQSLSGTRIPTLAETVNNSFTPVLSDYGLRFDGTRALRPWAGIEVARLSGATNSIFICCAYIHSEVESVVLQRWADPVTAIELGPALGPRMFDLPDLGRLMDRIAAKVQVVARDALRGSLDGYRELLEQGAVYVGPVTTWAAIFN